MLRSIRFGYGVILLSKSLFCQTAVFENHGFPVSRRYAYDFDRSALKMTNAERYYIIIIETMIVKNILSRTKREDVTTAVIVTACDRFVFNREMTAAATTPDGGRARSNGLLNRYRETIFVLPKRLRIIFPTTRHLQRGVIYYANDIIIIRLQHVDLPFETRS